MLFRSKESVYASERFRCPAKLAMERCDAPVGMRPMPSHERDEESLVSLAHSDVMV